MGNEKAIYFFAPSAENISKFESIQNDILGFLYFTTQLVKIGDTEIKTNFIDPITGQQILATVEKTYYCTSFDYDDKIHELIMSFDDVHYFSTQQEGENFKKGII